MRTAIWGRVVNHPYKQSILIGIVSVLIAYWRATRMEIPSCMSDTTSPHDKYLDTSYSSTVASEKESRSNASDCGVVEFAAPTTVRAAAFAGEPVTFCCAPLVTIAGEIGMVAFPLPSLEV
jgi:hypothetical protein